ncbi:AI-2E family transporter [Leifsonia sp. fls2-241-R2A-40a]|uniref:AI-2E family transporter n=1 Tax=Leifsonia sp. fls2-241-R2A-40a TaxID=3040290 RepID=UPI00255081D2|nr:AI-2E family transporter [Leifsonia sp. fls2-241-R2A-40a]
MSDTDRPVPPPVTAPGAGPVGNRVPARPWFPRRGREPGDRAESIDEAVPRGMRIAGAWSWRLLLVGAVIAVVIFLVIQLKLIVIPVLIAVLLGGLLVPFKDFLLRHRWPKWLAILAVLITLVIIVGGLFYLAIWQVTREAGQLQKQSVQAFNGLQDWLTTGPLGLSHAQIGSAFSSLGKSIQQDGQVFLSGALSVGSTLGHVFAGALLVLFSTIFILIDGKGIWAWIVRVFPKNARPAVDGAGKAGWVTLRNFAKVQVLVASIDALGIGLGAFFLGLPLVIPIAVLVFLGSFIPVVGAVVTGALAIFIALVFKGWVFALIMLGVVLLVQQIEGHVLQPLIMGSAVKVHPLAVVLSVAAGSLLAGIPGALFAVPFVAVLNVMVHYISSGAWRSPGSAVPWTDAPDRAIWETVPRTVRRPQDRT